MRHFIHAGKFALLAVTLNGMAAWAQFNNSGTTTIAVSVSAEAAIRIDTSSTSLANSGQMFADYTGTTNFTYKIRTSDRKSTRLNSSH